MLAHMRGMFQVMDKDESGTITFEELLAELYPYASEAELKQMLEWVCALWACGLDNSS